MYSKHIPIFAFILFISTTSLAASASPPTSPKNVSEPSVPPQGSVTSKGSASSLVQGAPKGPEPGEHGIPSVSQPPSSTNATEPKNSPHPTQGNKQPPPNFRRSGNAYGSKPTRRSYGQSYEMEYKGSPEYGSGESYNYAYRPYSLIDNYICDMDASIIVVTNTEKRYEGKESYGAKDNYGGEYEEKRYGKKSSYGGGKSYGKKENNYEYKQKGGYGNDEGKYPEGGEYDSYKKKDGEYGEGYTQKGSKRYRRSTPYGSYEKPKTYGEEGYEKPSGYGKEGYEVGSGYKKRKGYGEEGGYEKRRPSYGKEGYGEGYGYEEQGYGKGGYREEGGYGMRKSSGYGGEERYGKGREEYGTSYGRGKGSEYGGSYKMNGYKKGGSYGKKNSYSVAKAHRLRCSAIAIASDEDCRACCQMAARNDMSIGKHSIIGFIVDYDEIRKPEQYGEEHKRNKRDLDAHPPAIQPNYENTAGYNKQEYGGGSYKQSSYGESSYSTGYGQGYGYAKKPYNKSPRCVCCAPKSYTSSYGGSYKQESRSYEESYGGGYGKKEAYGSEEGYGKKASREY